MPMSARSQEEFEQSFWAKVDKTSDPQGCWLWTKCKTSGNYGHVWHKGRMEKSHKIAYLLSGKTIPQGLDLAHSELCIGKKHCCNPDHITPKTRSDNAMDKWRDGTMHCKLTREQVNDIKIRTDKTTAELAKEYNVSYAWVWKIRN